jgi:thymidylate synthase (FAD)
MTEVANSFLCGFTRAIDQTEDTAVGAILQQAQTRFPEKLIEYAGRVCYASEANMGKNDDFIAARLREGHEDIVEHAWASVLVDTNLASLPHYNNIYLYKAQTVGGVLLSGNLRAWRQVFVQKQLMFALPHVAQVAPSVFFDFTHKEVPLLYQDQPVLTRDAGKTVFPRVQLLGLLHPRAQNVLVLLHGADCDHHGAATFVLDGVTRALTHQLVRHRLASFSQQSQRYADLDKANIQPVIPPAIVNNIAAAQLYVQHWEQTKANYSALRELGVRKEDARFLLPNGATTKIVVTMSFAGWRHFLWLRALDKAAQWEIRGVAQDILRCLYTVARSSFEREWDYFQEYKDKLEVTAW